MSGASAAKTLRAEAKTKMHEEKRKKNKKAKSLLLHKSRAQEIADIRHQAQTKALANLKTAYARFTIPEGQPLSFSQPHGIRRINLNNLSGSLSASLPSESTTVGKIRREETTNSSGVGTRRSV